MRRMLDPKEAGGSLPSTIKFDAEGNRTVGKDLGVDGKLKLKSLVSASNPDGDITKELGGGGVKLTQEIKDLSLSIHNGSYEVGDISNKWELTVEHNLVSVYLTNGSDIAFTIGTAAFIVLTTLSNNNKGYYGIKFVCIKEGTVSKTTIKDITITLTSIA